MRDCLTGEESNVAALSKARSGPHPLIVLVHPDDADRRRIHLILRGEGYEIRSYASARTLLADREVAGAPWLIVSDAIARDERDVLDALRARGWGGRLLVIMGGAADGSTAVGWAGASYIGHPLSSRALKQWLTAELPA